MNMTLTVSSQGQIVIPKAVRTRVGIKPGGRVLLTVRDTVTGPEIGLKPNPVEWVKALAGTAKGIYGNVDDYIEKERNSWERSR